MRSWSHLQRLELYDVESDPGERQDVAAAHPEVVRDLQAEYAAWVPCIKKPAAWAEERWKLLAPGA